MYIIITMFKFVHMRSVLFGIFFLICYSLVRSHELYDLFPNNSEPFVLGKSVILKVEISARVKEIGLPWWLRG